MSRRRRAVKRKVVADPKYGSTLVARLVSILMLEGKKSIAQKVVYGAMDNLGEKNPSSSPLDLLQRAVDNAKPRLEVKPRRVGGATYQVPREVNKRRQQSLAIRWMVDAARSKRGKPMAKCLAEEIFDAYNNQGAAVTKKENVHKMAEANSAYSHFAW